MKLSRFHVFLVGFIFYLLSGVSVAVAIVCSKSSSRRKLNDIVPGP